MLALVSNGTKIYSAMFMVGTNDTNVGRIEAEGLVLFNVNVEADPLATVVVVLVRLMVGVLARLCVYLLV